MSWKFPKHPIKDRAVPDADEMNENFLASGQELVGRLNEHNFKAAIFAQGDVHPRSAFVWHTASSTGNNKNYIPYTFGPSTYNTNDDLKVTSPLRYQIFAETQSWQEVTDSILTFSSPVCIAQIHASAQIWVDGGPSLVSAGGGFRSGDIHPSQPQMAIKVDGVVLPETITGGTETAQDEWLGARPKAFAVPSLTSAVIPLPPGAHRLSIVVRCIGVPTNRGLRVASNELICLEMRA